VPASERPPVTPVFFAFRIMVGLGTLMLLLAWVSAFQLWRRKLLDSPWLLRGWNWMLPSGFIALLSGWFVTEMGRQPWVVYGVLRTADAVGPQSAWMTALSLGVYVVGYAFVFGWGIWYLVKILRHGPQPHAEGRRWTTAATPRHARCRRPTNRWRSADMDLMTWLPVAWFAVIGFGVLMYVVLDGFVLGIGILAPFAEDEEQLDLMMNTAAPIWDGNETWLVLGGAGLLAAFPKAYAVLLSALYLPVLLLVVALVFRGVAFEFRFKAHRSRRLWSVAFGLGSLLATFAQGVILGTLVQGIPLVDGVYQGGPFAWFSPFAMLTGAALVAGYALLGSTWLILKTEGRVQALARQMTRPLVVAVIAAMGLVSSWLPFLDSRLMAAGSATATSGGCRRCRC
jgi:hypothetical protein